MRTLPRVRVSNTWHMTDASAGGYSLLWDNITASNARVGELVAIVQQKEPAEKGWQLGDHPLVEIHR